MREIQACNAHSFLNQFVQDVDRGTGRACGCVRERRGSVDTLRGCLFFFNVAICSFFSRELFVATFLINSSNGAGIPSSLTPLLLNNGANYLAPLPSPVHLWCRLCASLSSFLPTKGADDASIPYDVRMAAGVKQTEMFQVCVGQLGIHLRHLRVCQECFSRV